jgi:ankyrin repeat protein
MKKIIKVTMLGISLFFVPVHANNLMLLKPVIGGVIGGVVATAIGGLVLNAGEKKSSTSLLNRIERKKTLKKALLLAFTSLTSGVALGSAYSWFFVRKDPVYCAYKEIDFTVSESKKLSYKDLLALEGRITTANELVKGETATEKQKFDDAVKEKQAEIEKLKTKAYKEVTNAMQSTNDEDLTKVLSNNGIADIKNEKGESLLLVLAREGKNDKVELFLRAGADLTLLDEQDAKTRPIIYKLIKEGKYDAVVMALSYIKDFDFLYKGRTMLHLAASMGDIKCMQTLLERGANPNLSVQADSEEKNGKTPLHFVIESQNPIEMIKLLLNYKADPNLNTTHEYTPLAYAKKLNVSREIIDLLEKKF